MPLENILSEEIIQKLGWTLLHFVWQAGVVALILGILLAFLRKSSANLRYIVACATLGLIVLLPIVTMQLIPVSTPLPIAGIEPPPAPVIVPTQPAAIETTLAGAPEYEEPALPESVSPAPAAPWKQRAVNRLEPALPYLVAGWLLGVLGLSLWHLGGWVQLQRLRKKMVRQVDASVLTILNRLSQLMAIKRAVQLAESALVQVPTVVGWLRPVILLPASALTGLTTEQLEALLVHELAHIRRYDYLINILQTIIETLGFYHPAVWWVSHRIRIERENCCDDLAVSISGDRVRYARALTSMEEIRSGRTDLAVAASGGNLFGRIRRLVTTESSENSHISWIPSAIAIMLIVALALPTTLALSRRSSNESHEIESSLLETLVDPKVSAEGQRILKQMAEVNRYWLIGPSKEVENYSYDFNLYDRDGKEPTQETIYVKRPTKVNSKQRQGITYDSILHRLIDDPSASIVRKILRNQQIIQLDFIFRDSTAVTCGNGISHSWHGYFTGLIKVGSLWLDVKKMVPVKVKAGWQEEHFSEYVAADEDHYVPLKITVGNESSRYHWKFCLYEPGLWLFENATYSLDEETQPRMAASINNLKINQRPAIKTKLPVVKVPEVNEDREVKDNKTSKQRKSVTLTLTGQGLLFNGQTITWDKFPLQLADMPEPENTGLKLVLAPDTLSSETMKDMKTRISILSRELGLKYLNCINGDVYGPTKSSEVHFFTAPMEFNKDIYIRQNATGEFKQKYKRNEKGWGTDTTEQHKEPATVYINSINFQKSLFRGNVSAKLNIAYSSWPKAMWQIIVRLLDNGGNSLAQASNDIDTGGYILSGKVLNMSSKIDFSLGSGANIPNVAAFEITVAPLPENESGSEPSAQFILDKMLEHRTQVRNLQYVAESKIWRDIDAEEVLIEEQIKSMREKGMQERQLERIRQSLLQVPENLYQIYKCTVDDAEHTKIKLTKGTFDSSGNKVPDNQIMVWAWNGVKAIDFSQRGESPGSATIKDTPQIATTLWHPWRSCTGIFCKFLQETIAAEKPVSIEKLKDGSFRAAFDYKTSRYSAIIDPSKGYTCPIVENYNKQGRLTSRETTTYEEVAAGIWFPVSGQREEFTAEGTARYRSIFESSQIRINDPAFNAGYFEVDMPKGAHVRDFTRNAEEPEVYRYGEPRKGYEELVRSGGKFVAGSVIDESGSPVAGVRVEVCGHKKARADGKFSWIFSGEFVIFNAITDEQGRFAIELQEDGFYNLRFHPENHAAIMAYDVPVGKKDLVVTLPEGGTISGRLVRIEGGRKVPIPAVEVKAEQSDRGTYSHLGFNRDRKTMTDSQGRFRFEHLRTKMRSPETRNSEQWQYSPRPWTISYEKTSKTVMFFEGAKTEEIDLVVEPDYTNPGSLIGKPLPGFVNNNEDMEHILSDPRANQFHMTWHGGGAGRREDMAVEPGCLRVYDVQIVDNPSSEAIELAGSQAKYGRIEFSDFGETQFTCGLKKSSDELPDPDIFFIDVNHNGRLEDKELFKGIPVNEPPLDKIHYGAIDIPLRGRDQSRIHRAFVWYGKYNDLYLVSHCYMQGRIRLGDKEVTAVLVDYNCDGRYCSGVTIDGHWETLGPAERDYDRIGWDADGDGRIQSSEQHFIGSYLVCDGGIFRVGCTPDGRTVAVVPAEVPTGRLLMPTKNAFVRLVGDAGPINLRITDGAVDVPAGTYRVDYLYIEEPDNDGKVTRLSKLGRYFDKPWDIPADVTTEISRDRCIITDRDKRNYEARMRELRGEGPQPMIASLLDEPLRNLSEFNIDLDSQKLKNRRILICFWDMDQRPSRNTISALAGQANEFRNKGVEVLLVHTSDTEPAKLKEWLNNRNIPFTCKSIKGNTEDILFRWGVRAQPWLILTDQNKVVRAEGFDIKQLDEKLEGNKELGFARKSELLGTKAAQIRCTGKVVDEQSRPIAGVKVTLHVFVYGLTSSLFDVSRESEVMTGADGAFSFSASSESDDYWAGYIVAEKQGFAPGISNWELRDGSKELKIKLGQPKELAGTVVDESGQPVSGAQVSVSRLKIVEGEEKRSLFGSLAEKLFTSTTDAAGKFVLTGLPADATAELIIKKAGKGTVNTYRRTADGQAKLNFAPGQTGIKLVLPDEARIEGVVVEKQSGKPVAGVKLEMRGAAHNRPYHETFESEDDGTFSIGSLTQGQYILDIVPSREGPADWAVDPVEVSIETGKTLNGVKLELSKGGLLEVVVTDAVSKQPVEKAIVGFKHEASTRRHYSATDKKGIARIRLMPEKYQISYVQKQDYTTQEPRNLVSVENGKTKRFEYELAKQPKITGIVRDEKDKPIEGVKLSLLPGSMVDFTSNTEGKFEINRDPQRWGSGSTTGYLIARQEHRNLAAIVELDEDVGTLEVKLKPGVILFGKVVDPEGKGIAGAWIMPMLRLPMVGFSMGRPRQITDSEGNFEIKTIPEGYIYYVQVSADGYGIKSSMEIQTDDLAADRRFGVGIITLPMANLSVSGIVVDINGKPVPGVAVNGYDDAPQVDRTTFTDEDGKFTLEKVCAGPIHITADRGGAKPLSGSRTTRGGAKNVRIVVSQRSLASEPEPRHTPPPSLVGKSLPQLKELGFDLSQADTDGKNILVCFWDMNQRPSRNFIENLNRREKELADKDVKVLLVHTPVVKPAKLKEWLDNHKVPFVCGNIEGDAKEVLLAWGVQAQPWLILTDEEGVVRTEGFDIKQLDEKLKQSIGSNQVVLKLVDPNSKPVVGARVGTFVDWSDIAENPPIWFLRYGRNYTAADVKSDEHGKVTLDAEDIFGSGWTPERKAPLTAIDEGHYLAGLRELSREDLGKEVTMTLQPGCRVYGQVTAATARKRKWSTKVLTVYTFRNSQKLCQYSSKQSQFEFVLPPGKYEVMVYSKDLDKAVTLPIMIKPGQRDMDLTKYLDGTSKPPAVQIDMVVDAEDSLDVVKNTRIVHFPQHQAVGNLKVRNARPDLDWDRGYLSQPGWSLLGPAQGDVSIAAGEDLRLEVSGDVTDFSFLADLKPNDLQVLLLSHKKISDEDLAGLKGLTGLLGLDLSSTPIDSVWLAHLSALTSLKELSLFDTQVSDAGLEHLSNLKSLKRLNLFITKIRGPGLKHLQNLTSLALLDLAATPITDAALEHVGRMTWLKELQLQDTDITDKGLAHLKSLRSLEMLVLGYADLKQGYSPITDDGLVHLKELDSLEYLHLMRTQVTGAGLAHLRNLKALKTIKIAEIRFTAKDIEFLKKETGGLHDSKLDGEIIGDMDVKNLEMSFPDHTMSAEVGHVNMLSPAPSGVDKSIVKIECLVGEVYSEPKMDRETIIAIENLLGGKITLPASPTAADLLRKAAQATAMINDKRVTQEQFNNLVDLLLSRGFVKILINPTLEVVELQTAQIKTDQNSLEVTANAVKDDIIYLTVKADLSSQVAPANEGQKPIISTRSFANFFSISSGQSQIIGGMIQPAPRSENGGNIKGSQTSARELMCIVTASIIAPADNEKQQDQATFDNEYEVIQVSHINANEAAERVNKVLSQLPEKEFRYNDSVYPIENTGQIIVFGRKDLREIVKKLISQLDTAGSRLDLRVFQLKYADPDLIKEKIEGSYKYPANEPHETVRVIAFPTTKQVTVIASPENLSRIAEQIVEWDTFQVFKPRIIKLQNSDPVQMARLLTMLFAEEDVDGMNIRDVIPGEDITGPLGSHFIFEDVPGTSKIIVMSNIPKAYETVGQLIIELDKQKMLTKNMKQVREWITRLVKEGRLGVPKTIDELEQSEEQKEPIETLNFENVEVRMMIEKLAEWTGKTIIPPDELMKQKITIYSPEPMPRSEAAAMILEALCSKGYTAEQTDDTIYLKPLPEEQPGTGKAKIKIEARIMTVGDEFLKEIGFDANSVLDINAWPEPKPSAVWSSDNLKTFNIALNDSNVDFLLKTAQAHKDTKILAAPKVDVWDRDTAEIAVSTEYNYTSGYSEPNRPGEEPTPKLDTAKSGTFLKITPQITPDKKDIIFIDFELEVRELQSVEDHMYKGKYPYQIPHVSVVGTRTQCLIPDGLTLLNCGQKITQQLETTSTLPILGGLPIGGGLFRSSSKVSDTRTLLVMIKPSTDIKAPPKPQPIDPGNPLIKKLE